MKGHFRIFSLFMALVMVITAIPFLHAEATTCTDSITLNIDSQSTKIKYRLDNNYVTYAEVDGNIFSREGNDILLNGEKIATITTTTISTSSAIEPRSGWIYGDNTCPSGASPSDYDTLFSTKSHNITFEKAIAELSVELILQTLIFVVPFINEYTGKTVFLHIAEIIYGCKELFADDCVYATEYIYSGGIAYTRKNVFYFYNDSAKQNYEGSATCYSSWA